MPRDHRQFRLAAVLSSLPGRGRRLVLAAGALFALALAGLPASASAAGLPPEGIFDNCNLNTQMSTCVQRLSVIQSGGFQVVVIDADEGTPSADASYAAAAQGMGMKVMWEISDPGWWDGTSVANDFPGYSTACGCSDNRSLLAYMIGFLGAQPGTWGYYAADDSMLGSSQVSAVASYVNQIKAVDSSHPVILSSGDEEQTAQFGSIGNMNAAENYPIINSSMMPVSANRADWSSVGQWAGDVQKMADRRGRSSAFILQAFSWGDNLDDGQAIGLCSSSMTPQQCWNAALYPTPADQLQMRNEVLQHANPSIILWWSFMGTYGQAGGDTYSIYPTGSAAAAHWAGLKAAINAPLPGLSASRRAKTRHHHRRHHHRHRRHRRHHRRG